MDCDCVVGDTVFAWMIGSALGFVEASKRLSVLHLASGIEPTHLRSERFPEGPDCAAHESLTEKPAAYFQLR